MWNNSSVREARISEISEQYNKLLGQNSVSKKNLIKLARKFKALKKEDELFRTLANRTVTIANNAKWSNPVAELNWFVENYKEFKELVIDSN